VQSSATLGSSRVRWFKNGCNLPPVLHSTNSSNGSSPPSHPATPLSPLLFIAFPPWLITHFGSLPPSASASVPTQLRCCHQQLTLEARHRSLHRKSDQGRAHLHAVALTPTPTQSTSIECIRFMFTLLFHPLIFTLLLPESCSRKCACNCSAGSSPSQTAVTPPHSAREKHVRNSRDMFWR
jgi:hypothetical protein